MIERVASFTLPLAPVIDKPIDVALWPRTRKGMLLYALAAVAAIIVGIIPALWINRWREAAEPITAEATPEEPSVAPVPSEPSAAPAPTPEREDEVDEADEDDAVEIEMPDLVTAERSSVTVRPTKRARPRRRAKPAAKRATPKCDIYLYPHGCPK